MQKVVGSSPIIRFSMRDEPNEAVGLLRRMGQSQIREGWRLLFMLVTLALIALPALVVWALVDSDLWMKVLGGTIGIGLCAAMIVMSAGTKYSGDW